MKKIIITATFLCFVLMLKAQVAINTDGSAPEPSAMLDIKSDTAGLLIPRLSSSQRDAISSPAQGLLVFVTTDSAFYFYKNNSWQELSAGNSVWKTQNSLIYTDSTQQVVVGKNSGSGLFQVITDKSTGAYTADKCEGGTASAQESAVGKNPSNAFDNSTTTYWSNDGNLPVWLQYRFASAERKVIGRYRIYFQGGSYDASPGDWEFQASNDGSSWTTLDSQSGETWAVNSWKDYSFTNHESYEYYRILISDNQGSSDDFVYINEMEMQELVYSNFPALFVDDNKTGIGTDSPSATLHVDGSLRFVDGNQGSGKILGSSADGTASWIDGADVNGGGWTVSGNFIYNMGDSIGIGTTTPESRLDVAGRITQRGIGESVFVGQDAGKNDDFSDNYNVAIGNKSLEYNVSGEDNAAIGYKSLWKNQDGNDNTAVGSEALSYNKGNFGSTAIGYCAMSRADNRITGIFTANTAIGWMALYGGGTYAASNIGTYNTAVGTSSLRNNIDGGSNTAIGFSSMLNNSSGFVNVAIGNNSLSRNRANYGSVAVGFYALMYADDRTSGRQTDNTAIGYYALAGSSTASNNSGMKNTAVGSETLLNNTTGCNNTAVGSQSLKSNETGSRNVAVGSSSLEKSSAGHDNVSIGANALEDNTNGILNTAVGSYSLHSNKSKQGSVAVGYKAMYYADNSTATEETHNTAVGSFALQGSTTSSDNTGKYNTALGSGASVDNTSGGFNTSVGTWALRQNTNGNYNTAIGYGAGFSCSGSGNVFIGHKAAYNVTGDSMLYISNSGSSVPLIFGNFVNERLGFGTNSPDAKLDIQAVTGEDPLRVRIGTVTKFMVHSNGGVSVGTFAEGPVRGILSYGNIEPNSHKGADLGTSSKAWDDIYYDDMHNMGASAFSGRKPSEEILDFPPKEKLPGSFDYKTERGDVELDPASLPPGLADDNSLLTDEISSYNYKTNYEQQLIINTQKKEIERLAGENQRIKALLMEIEARISRLENK